MPMDTVGLEQLDPVAWNRKCSTLTGYFIKGRHIAEKYIYVC